VPLASSFSRRCARARDLKRDTEAGGYKESELRGARREKNNLEIRQAGNEGRKGRSKSAKKARGIDLGSSDKIDCRAAMVIRFLALNDQRDDTTETLRESQYKHSSGYLIGNLAN